MNLKEKEYLMQICKQKCPIVQGDQKHIPKGRTILYALQVTEQKGFVAGFIAGCEAAIGMLAQSNQRVERTETAAHL